MSLANGDKANATTFNNTFVSKTDDVTKTGKLNLHDPSSTNVNDVQKQIASINSQLGRTGSEAYNAAGAVNTFGLKIPMTDFSVANGQATTTFLDVSAYQAVHIKGQLKRTTATNEKSAIVDLYAFKRFNSAAWDLTPEFRGDDDYGVTWTITTAGVIKYATDSLGGSGYSGTFTYCGMTFN